MITLLSHLFIKNRDDVTNPAVRRAYGQLCGMVGIALNLVLFAGKFFAGTLSGSVAIMASVNFPSFQFIAISKFPRAFRPETEPSVHTSGKAGNR